MRSLVLVLIAVLTPLVARAQQADYAYSGDNIARVRAVMRAVAFAVPERRGAYLGSILCHGSVMRASMNQALEYADDLDWWSLSAVYRDGETAGACFQNTSDASYLLVKAAFYELAAEAVIEGIGGPNYLGNKTQDLMKAFEYGDVAQKALEDRERLTGDDNNWLVLDKWIGTLDNLGMSRTGL